MLPKLLPPEVDLTDLPFIPLHDQRLRKSRSWLLAKSWRGHGPGLGFCLLNLWCGAFRSVPAGSLEDCDEVLADTACVSVEHWKGVKKKALRGWKRETGMVWHPYLSQLAWDVWLARLQSRHFKAHDSYRAATKRAMDKGIEPSQAPGDLLEWMQANYPETYAYQALLQATKRPVPEISSPSDNLNNPSDNRPKRSKGKLINYTSREERPVENKNFSLQTVAERKSWFVSELNRLRNEFRPMLDIMLVNLQKPGVIADFGLVKTFKGCWIERNPAGQIAIVAPSYARVSSITKEHGIWLFHYWPGLIVRHAKVDELRARQTK